MSSPTQIVWLHGWGSSPAAWAGLPGALEGYRHRFVSYRQCRQPADFADAVRAVWPEGGAVVVGWSMGAMLAIELADELPGMAALAVFGGSLRFCGPGGWPAAVLRRMRQNLQADPAAVIEAFTRRLFSAQEAAMGHLQHYRRDVLGSEPLESIDFTAEGLAAGLDYLAKVDLHQQFAALDLPLLWLHGQEDMICPPGNLPALPAPQLDVLPATGHCPFLTCFEMSVQRLQGLLESLP